MQQAGYHHANMLAAQLRIDMDNRNNEMLAMVQNQMLVTEENLEPAPENPSANAISQDSVQLEMLKLLRVIQSDLKTSRNPTPSQNTHNPSTGGSTRRNRQKTPDDASFPRRTTDKYCWTHGGSNHSAADCSRQAEGHKMDATFTSRKGGSNDFCPAIE